MHGAQGQAPLGAPSVFNFYRPDYTIASTGASDDGTDEDVRTVAPELQVATDTWVVTSLNRLAGHVSEWSIGTAPAIESLDALAREPSDFVHHLNLVLFGGSMSPEMQTIVVNYAEGIPVNIHANQRIAGVLSLLATSPQFSIQH